MGLDKPDTGLRVGIVGAGLAGLACADALVAAGHRVWLFDKGRGPGGRMATRRVATALGEASFDHGAQYFTARDPGFAALAEHWCAQGIARRWPAAGADAWVGVPGMSAVIRERCAGHRVEFGALVKGLAREGGRWRLVGLPAAHDPFDAVVVAIPAEQAAGMVSLHDFAMARVALLARSLPCWTAMFAFAAPLPGAPPLLRDKGMIGWAARNSAKPARTGPEAWVVQASAEWSQAWLEQPAPAVEAALLAGLLAELGLPATTPIHAAAHRWRYALSAGTGQGALWNPHLRLGLCGDWLLGPRVECAWLSGGQLARAMIAAPDQRAGGAAGED